VVSSGHPYGRTAGFRLSPTCQRQTDGPIGTVSPWELRQEAKTTVGKPSGPKLLSAPELGDRGDFVYPGTAPVVICLTSCEKISVGDPSWRKAKFSRSSSFRD